MGGGFAVRFEAFFKKDLAKRLLQRSASEGELAATTWLREECGGAYTAGRWARKQRGR